MPTLVDLKPLDKYQLWVKYADGTEGTVDLSDFAGQGVFALWNDYREFGKAHVGSSGEITWNDDVDLDSDAIYLQLTGKKPDDIFPKLRELIQHAGD